MRDRSVTVTKREGVLRLLRLRGKQGVTHLLAEREIGTSRIAARVYDLRNEGYVIERHWLTTPGGARVARYVLVDEPPKQLRLDVA